MLTSFLTAVLTVLGGYYLYQRQKIWNEKRKHYEFILTELEYMAEAGHQIMESCDQEIYRMGGMEEDEEKYLVEYDIGKLKNEMYKRIYNIKSKMPIMELYITDKTAESVLTTIEEIKKRIMLTNLAVDRRLNLMAEKTEMLTHEDYEDTYKNYIKEIIDLRFTVHTVIKNEMKRTNTWCDKLMKQIGV